MNEKTSKINPNGLAIVEALSSRKGETFAFAELANLANIEPKTGYLTSAKKIASERGMKIEKVEGAVKVEIQTFTQYPSGLKVEGKKESLLDGYRLTDKE